ncbi:MAG: beta-Ala-His dipeptidase [Candidatus Electronema sp. V4]|uniref:beta-Ala-His dipeptidase n=1 Tax=Candidatus Electronema sp. V4 TaxID=3454756 RepID=UPI00405574E0
MDATQAVLDIFKQISLVFPRSSGHETNIMVWLQQRANRQGFATRIDDVGNLLIKVPATPGYEAAPCIVLQCHMDMVWLPAIQCVQETDQDGNTWLRAGSTLGADDGIGLALAMALVEAQEGYTPAHPSLELLFTVQEETGMGGANGLQPGFITGKILVNIDSEEEGVFINGCAGGEGVAIALLLAFGKPVGDAFYNLKIDGLKGGHSGVDIDKGRASANKLMAASLDALNQITPLELGSFAGGSKDNAIASSASASFAFASAQAQALGQAVQKLQADFKQQYKDTDPDITLTFTKLPTPLASTAGQGDTTKVISLLMAIPHGVYERYPDGSVKTSDNLAIVGIDGGQTLNVTTSQRSPDTDSLHNLSNVIIQCGKAVGATAGVITGSTYPGWDPNPNSPLLQQCKNTYKYFFGEDPQVTTIHAGLECGLIGTKYEGMDMLSIGATIKDPHSTGERLLISSVGKVWELLVALLASYKS